MATLYRKYRPQNFSEIFGQNHIKITLEHEIASNKIAHAYLFCGPRAIGKTTIARVFAKAVNCETRTPGQHEPCNQCPVCAEISAGRNLDVIEIDAASHTGVDNVRENIITVSRLAPSRSKYKVFIIDEAHMLSASAFNALLKTLEEPPATAIFILCTTEVHKIPATIISRCQRFDFKRISIPDVVKKLEYVVRKEQIQIDRTILEAIARHSEGHMRDAESLLGQVISIGGKEITQAEADLVIPRSDLGEAIKLVGLIGKKDAGAAVGLINKLIDDGIDLKVFVKELIELGRRIMFMKINPALSGKLGLELGESVEMEINKASQGLTLPQAIATIEKFSEAQNSLKTSFIMQLPLEIAAIELCLGPTRPIASWANTTVNRPPVATAPSPRITPAASQTPTVPATTSDFQINKAEVLKKWNEVLIRVKKYNHSLSFILRVCEPREVNSNQLCLAFKYKFHKDRIGDVSIKQIVEKVLQEVYNLPLTIEAIIDENLEVNSGNQNFSGNDIIPVPNEVGSGAIPQEAIVPPPGTASSQPAENGGMIDNLLKTFGGKVVG